MKLTVIFRNDMPMIYAGDCPVYRSVQINLTSEQIEKIKCRTVGMSHGNDVYEEISKCFIEESNDA